MTILEIRTKKKKRNINKNSEMMSRTLVNDNEQVLVVRQIAVAFADGRLGGEHLVELQVVVIQDRLRGNGRRRLPLEHFLVETIGLWRPGAIRAVEEWTSARYVLLVHVVRVRRGVTIGRLDDGSGSESAASAVVDRRRRLFDVKRFDALDRIEERTLGWHQRVKYVYALLV